MTTPFASLDDVAAAFALPTQSETEALFLQGAVIKSAVEQGWDIDEVAAYCGNVVGRSKRTVYRRYSVAQTFPIYDKSVVWELYAVAADVVDYRQTDAAKIAARQAAAHEWITQARAEQWSTRQLRQEIAGKRVTDRIVLLDCVQATVWEVISYPNDKMKISLLMDRHTFDAACPTAVQVTIVTEVPNAESEAA